MILFRRKQQKCICPHGERSLGMLDRVNMGRGIVRLSTAADCPEHDACHRWTKENRAKYVVGREAWSLGPWCPIHKDRDCLEFAALIQADPDVAGEAS